MKEVQLRSIWCATLTSAYGAGVKWACKMLPAAAVLYLPVQWACIVAQNFARKACDLAGLHQLHLDYDIKGNDKKERSFPCVPWLLTWANNLNLADVHLGSNPWLPPLTHIKHLILVLEDDIGNTFEALPEATSLETLSISRSEQFSECYFSEGPLVLNMLPCLVSVALEMVCPETCSIPEDCRLSLHKFRLRHLKDDMWQGKEGTICSISVNHYATDMSDITKYIGKLHALVSVATHLTAASPGRDPVCKLDLCCLQHVKRFRCLARIWTSVCRLRSHGMFSSLTLPAPCACKWKPQG